MEAIINNIIKYQKENNITRMCGPTVMLLRAYCKYWFKDIDVIVTPSIVICMKAGHRKILAGHVNIIINGELFETSYEVLNLISESDNHVYYHNWHDAAKEQGLCGCEGRARQWLKEFLYFNDAANRINNGGRFRVEDEKTKKYLDELTVYILMNK